MGISDIKFSEGETPLPAVGVKAGLRDSDLLDLVQRQTLRYFWDYGHPGSGMARERIEDGEYTLYDCSETVTTGGTGFGIMGMLAGVSRGWLVRDEVYRRLERIVTFLERAETHRGVFPHFLDGRTGRASFFTSPETGPDDPLIFESGGNLVETAFLFMGLLSARQFFSAVEEAPLRDRINALWQAVQWNAHLTPDGRNLQWLNHPVKGLGNWPVTGWNEAMVTHILAAASPTYPVPASVYHTGWASGHDFYRNGQTYYGHKLPLGPHAGGPLFFSHYSFMGLDPRGLSDRYADYWTQNKTHSQINYEYCIRNPQKFDGYGQACWGLTASDNPKGYNVHKPDALRGTFEKLVVTLPRKVRPIVCNTPDSTDDGTIAPTAAVSSFPYVREQSMRAIRFFYEKLGNRLWTDMGFVDAFNLSKNWVAKSHLAIDQGPIVVMIENQRSGLLWRMFMSCPEVQHSLELLGFRTQYRPRNATSPS